MKSSQTLIGISILLLVFAVAASTSVWSAVPSAAKIGMYVFGFGSGVAVGALIVRRQMESH